MKPRTHCVCNCMLGLSLLACTAALTACGSEEPKPAQNQMSTNIGTAPSTTGGYQSPYQGGPPKGTPNTTP